MPLLVLLPLLLPCAALRPTVVAMAAAWCRYVKGRCDTVADATGKAHCREDRSGKVAGKEVT